MLGSLAVAGCANPLNRTTSDRYAAECVRAESANALLHAEQACYRALVNVDMGNLGPQLKSQRLYNLGRIKRRLAKFNEAEDLYRQSIEIERKLSGPESILVGRRLAELSAVLASTNRWSEGASILQQLIPIADRFSGAEREFLAKLFSEYAKQDVNAALSEQFMAKASQLGVK